VCFKILRKAQTRCLRKEHEDAHWVAALAKYNKVHLVRARDAAVEAGYERGILAAGLDDKKAIPVGLPGLPVDSGARPHGPVWSSREQVTVIQHSVQYCAVLFQLQLHAPRDASLFQLQLHAPRDASLFQLCPGRASCLRHRSVLYCSILYCTLYRTFCTVAVAVLYSTVLHARRLWVAV
jgi:hypothetical protein